jgi:uncharacterized GH25 family protein
LFFAPLGSTVPGQAHTAPDLAEDMMNRLTLLAACAAVGAATPALAHDIWVTTDKRADGKVVADVGYGDRDDRSLPDLEKVVTMDAIGPSGVTHLRSPLKATTRLGQPVIETPPFAIEPGTVIAIAYDNGFWVRIPGDRGQTNTTVLMAPGGTEAHWTVKYTKLLYGPGAYSKVLNQRLELTALKDPFTLKRGEPLPVRVDYEGKPVADMPVQYGDGISPIPVARLPKIKTGADGVALIPMERVGAYLLVVDGNYPATDKRFADYDHVFSSLSFDLTK